MTFNKLASAIAKREGKKHQASVGDVREIISTLATLIAEDMVAHEDNDTETFRAFETLVNKKCEKLWAKKKAAQAKEKARAAKAAQPKTPKKK